MKGVLPRLDQWAHRVGTRDFSLALVALVRQVQNNFFKSVFLNNEITGYGTIKHIYILTLSSSMNRLKPARQVAEKSLGWIFTPNRLDIQFFIHLIQFHFIWAGSRAACLCVQRCGLVPALPPFSQPVQFKLFADDLCVWSPLHTP